MGTQVSLGVEDGLPVVRQMADRAGAERLRRAADQLGRAAHPGVVRVVASRPLGDGWELVTEHGGLVVASARLRGPEQVAALGSSVASTLADLHERGIAHGRLDATRILVGRAGRPVLCGFAPSGADAPAALPADDVAALGAVLGALMGSIEPSGASARAREALEAIVERSTAAPATRRPSARRLAAELASPTAPAGHHRTRARIGIGASVAVLVVALFLLGRRTPSTGAPTVGRPVATIAPAGREPPCVATRAQALRAAGCGHDATVDGPAVVVDGHRFVVGLEGDEVAVADWGCAGGLRAAVLRPTTGEVRVFSPFALDGTPSVVRAERVPGARSLDVREVQRCPVLGVLEARTSAP